MVDCTELVDGEELVDFGAIDLVDDEEERVVDDPVVLEGLCFEVVEVVAGEDVFKFSVLEEDTSLEVVSCVAGALEEGAELVAFDDWLLAVVSGLIGVVDEVFTEDVTEEETVELVEVDDDGAGFTDGGVDVVLVVFSVVDSEVVEEVFVDSVPEEDSDVAEGVGLVDFMGVVVLVTSNDESSIFETVEDPVTVVDALVV